LSVEPSDMPPPVDIAALYDAHSGSVFAFALNLTRSEADARDILQEVFVRLARQPESFQTVRDPRGFLLRSAHNLAVDSARRRESRNRRHEVFQTETLGLFAGTEDPDEATFRAELAEALGELPEDQRAVLHLKLWERRTFEQIAETLDLSPNTAASRYRYGLDKLRTRLRPLYDEIR
jgi:RNA polymerase sigma-70 factor, ECF subfamily